MKNDFIAKIVNLKELPNGELEGEIIYGQEFKDILKSKYKRKGITAKLVQKFILEAVDEFIKKNEK